MCGKSGPLIVDESVKCHLFYRCFNGSEDVQVSVFGLQLWRGFLCSVAEFPFPGFSIDSTRSMVAMYDVSLLLPANIYWGLLYWNGYYS